MRPRIRIKAADIALNTPLPFSLYDASGKLLLRAGTAISMPRYLDALLATGAYFDQAEIALSRQAASAKPKAAETPPVFEQVEGLLLNLKHVFSTFAQEAARIDLQKRIRHLAQQLQQACGEDADAALAALHLDQAAPYRVQHQMLCAVIVEIAAREMELAAEERLPLVCAALTHDLSLIAAGDALEHSKAPPTPAQRALIDAHPQRSVAILSGCGVSDARWLETVGQHHERRDGSGYPAGRHGDDIAVGARLLAVADIYGAMIRPRPYRGNAYFPQNALREIFRDQERVDTASAQLTIKSIGMMPPGSIVRLANNEIGVVKSRAAGARPARVHSVYNPAGMPLINPVERDVRISNFAVAGKVNFDECRSAEIIMRRLWTVP